MKHRLLRALLTLTALLAPVAAFAQSYTLAPYEHRQYFDNNGNPCALCQLYTYTAQTVTLATTYADASGTTNANPVVMNGSGRPANGGNEVGIYLAIGTSYKFILKTAAGATIWTQDNIAAVPPSAANLDITPAVAGEALAAGDVAYLSDGSGGKNSGQWYKADADFTYASTTPEIGVAPAAIAAAASGSMRIAGAITGLSALSTTSEYFVSATAGAMTTTAPTNRRHVGHADSATTLILTGNPPPPPVITAALANDFRLSLTTGTCVTTVDVTAAATLYLTPCAGNRITLFDTSGNVEICTTAEVSIAVPATTAQMYDVWAYDSTFGTCTVTLELLAWTNDTTRATAIARTNGRWTKSGNSSRLLQGSFRTTTVAGQTEDSFAKRYVSNVYNREQRIMRVIETTDSWAYNGALRQARLTATNQLDFVLSVAGAPLEANIVANVSGNAAMTTAYVAIGFDSTTVAATGSLSSGMATFNTGIPTTVQAQLKTYPAVGRHVAVWLETAGAATTTWYGDNASDGAQSGIHGVILN